MGTTLSQLITDTTIRAQPSILTIDGAQTWPLEVLAQREAYCETTRTKYIYVSKSGSDSNDGLTTTTPVLTLAKAEALLATSGTGTQILLNRGDMWQNEYLAITTDNTYIGAYGTGQRPVIMGADKIANGATWTDEGSNRYSISISPLTAIDLCFVGDPTTSQGFAKMRDEPMQQTTSTALVESNASSFYVSGTTLHVHMLDGTDPTSTDVWHRTRNTTVPTSASGVLLSGTDQCLIDELRVLGFGNQTGNQDYNIKVLTTGATDHNVVRGCDLYYNAGHHVFGSFTIGSGGITLFKRLSVGYCCSDSLGDSTIGVSYAADGDHEFYLWQVVTDGGQLDHTNARGDDCVSECIPYYTHGTSPANDMRFCISYGCTYNARAGNQLGDGLKINNQPAAPANQDDFDSYSALIISERVDGGGQPGALKSFGQVDSVARVNCSYVDMELREQSATTAANVTVFHGLLINCEFEFHAASEDGEIFGWKNVVVGDMTAVMLYCNMRFTWAGTSTNEANSNTKGFSPRAWQPFKNKIFNSIFTMQCDSADADTWNTYGMDMVNFADNAVPDISANTGGYSYCAFHFIRPTNRDNYRGFSASEAPLDLSNNFGSGTPDYSAPPIGTRPASGGQIVGYADDTRLAASLEYDATWAIRSNSVLGPLELQPPLTSGHLETNLKAYLAASGVVAPVRPFVGSVTDVGDLVTYTRVATEYDHHLGGASTLAWATIQYDCWGDTYLEAVALAESLRLVLQGLNGSIGTTTPTNVRSVFAGNTWGRHEKPADGEGSAKYRQTFEIRVAYFATAPTAA